MSLKIRGGPTICGSRCRAITAHTESSMIGPSNAALHSSSTKDVHGSWQARQCCSSPPHFGDSFADLLLYESESKVVRPSNPSNARRLSARRPGDVVLFRHRLSDYEAQRPGSVRILDDL